MKKISLEKLIEEKIISSVKQELSEFNLTDYVTEKKIRDIVEDHVHNRVVDYLGMELDRRIIKETNILLQKVDPDIKRAVVRSAGEILGRDFKL